MDGTTATHLAELKTSPGMPLSGAAIISSKTVVAACTRSAVLVCAQLLSVRAATATIVATVFIPTPLILQCLWSALPGMVITFSKQPGEVAVFVMQNKGTEGASFRDDGRRTEPAWVLWR